MFTQTWKIYLPVIAILIKRSSAEEQTLKMNLTDFERATGGRKIKFSFNNLQLNKGRINSDGKHTVLAKDLATVLQEDEKIKPLLSNEYLLFSLSNDLTLTIINNSDEQVKETAIENEVNEEAVETDETAEVEMEAATG